MDQAIYIKPMDETRPCEHCGGVVQPKWTILASDGETEVAGPFDTRAEAKDEAIHRRVEEAVILLRADGSVHSEVRAAGEPDKRAKALKRDGIVVNGGTARDGDD